ncbi:alpha/beta hydrolase [Aquimarina sp. AU58]|uniref:alpha/beta hydrolase n=1 Tax=Aquimarina sp. AU58 TaxID=1874112 RepID=UPI000D64F865|nr:alpha/beta hydrolase [Aquimarina sp. AU58]
MKPKLIILSDLWGKKKSDWVAYYIKELQDHFVLQYYDCCELGALDTSIYTEENLHKQFTNGGIDRAVQNLLTLEKGKIHILAFSVGGVIGWKSAIKNQNIVSLYAVSSTRLRYETNKPKTKIKLYFGENDIYSPKNEWYALMGINAIIEKEKKHQLYIEPEFAIQLSNRIKNSINH